MSKEELAAKAKAEEVELERRRSSLRSSSVGATPKAKSKLSTPNRRAASTTIYSNLVDR